MAPDETATVYDETEGSAPTMRNATDEPSDSSPRLDDKVGFTVWKQDDVQPMTLEAATWESETKCFEEGPSD